MAGYELIDNYVGDLRRHLSWSPDRDDLAAEAHDHLLCAVDQLIDAGASSEDAQQAVLDRFGNSSTVAAAHAATSKGGIAMPTKFTRLAGMAAMASAVLWIASALAWLTGHFMDPSDSAQTALAWFALTTLFTAAGTTTLLVVGLTQRHGGLGLLGNIGLGLLGLGVLATLMFWFVMGRGALLALGMLLIAIALRSRGLAPIRSTIAFGSAWGIGVITWSILRLLEVGTRDQWGDYPIVSPTAIAVGVAILAPGLIGLGRWLSTETPLDIDHPAPVPTS